MATIVELTKMRAALFAARMNGTRSFQDQNGERGSPPCPSLQHIERNMT